jgi:outer membrane protein assembly factor BamB
MSVWKLRHVLAIAVVLAAGDARHPSLGVVTAQQVVTIMPLDLQPVPDRRLPTAERLAQLHKVLASAGDPHDVILESGRIGDPSSVPFLIEALAKYGTVPREGRYSAIDTRFAVLDALQEITNHNAGRNAEDWRPWYETNKDKTQQQWIEEGFAERGLPVSDPPDDAFVTALIRASDPQYQPGYLQTNALRMLRTVPSDTLVRLAKGLSTSKESADRRATVAALERVDGAARLDVLRGLTKDADIDVAENALRALNGALRSSLPAVATETVWQVRLARVGVHVLEVLDDHTVVLGIGYGGLDKTRVAGFDLVTHEIIWTYRTADGVRSNAVRIGDRLYFVSDDRVLHCISVTGKPVWAKPLASNRDWGTVGPAIVAAFDRLFVPDYGSLYVVTPDGRIRTYAMGKHVRRVVQGRRRLFSAVDNALLVAADPAKPPIRVSTGLRVSDLSASGDAVCVVSSGPVYQLQCLDQDSLRELWRADLPYELGGYSDLAQDADNVYVLAQGRALGFNVASGRRLWATNEFRSFPPFKLLRGLVLTRDSGPLEWRDRFSGEVIAPWDAQSRSYATNAQIVGDDRLLLEVRGPDDEGDGLRLVKLPDALMRLFKDR